MSKTHSTAADPSLPDLVQPDRRQAATPIHLVDKASYEEWLKGRTPAQRAALAGQKFKGEAGSHAIIPDGDGFAVAAGVARLDVLGSWCLGKLGDVLPGGFYRLVPAGPCSAGAAFIGWALGQYRYDRYRQDGNGEAPRVLLTGEVKAIAPALAEAGAVALVRDLVNTPAEHLGPAELEHEAELLAKAHRAAPRHARRGAGA